MRTAKELKELIETVELGEITVAMAQVDEPNARIIPEADILIITRGLNTLLDDEEMLAVLLHEKSHLDREELRSEHINGYDLPDICKLRERIADLDAVKGLEERGISKEAMVRAINKVSQALGLDFMADMSDHPSVNERLENILKINEIIV